MRLVVEYPASGRLLDDGPRAATPSQPSTFTGAPPQMQARMRAEDQASTACHPWSIEPVLETITPIRRIYVTSTSWLKTS